MESMDRLDNILTLLPVLELATGVAMVAAAVAARQAAVAS